MKVRKHKMTPEPARPDLAELVHNLAQSIEFWHREAYVHLKEKDAWFSGHVVRDRELIAKARATFPLPTKDD